MDAKSSTTKTPGQDQKQVPAHSQPFSHNFIYTICAKRYKVVLGIEEGRRERAGCKCEVVNEMGEGKEKEEKRLDIKEIEEVGVRK
ncbi:3372_t:CDS:2 [Funneliformis mosseae]|uniref:3372_t:CDS:1 n=1 Tax=Funneliformis mosseae TaxID=27381 RepID=A0A9N8ZMP2_FUNMO|nr:3372_t:CDS:2 [Funneliformis mosseae]